MTNIVCNKINYKYNKVNNSYYFYQMNGNNILYYSLYEDDFCCGNYNMGSIIVNIPIDAVNILKWLLKDENSPLIGNNSYNSQRTNILCTLANQTYIDAYVAGGFTVIGTFKNCKTDNNVSILQGIIEHDLTYDEDD